MKRKFEIVVDMDVHIDEEEMLNYIADGVTTMRGCYSPEASVHAFRLLQVRSVKMILNTEPSFGYGYLGDGDFLTEHSFYGN